MKECRKIADLLGAYVYGDLEPAEMRRVRTHADECEACRREIDARMKVVSLVPSELPELTDEERLRITWAVKGAVRVKEESVRPFAYGMAALKGFALAVVIGAAFVGGAFYTTKTRPPRVIVKMIPAPAVPSPSPNPNQVAAAPESVPAPQQFAMDTYRRYYGVESSRWLGTDRTPTVAGGDTSATDDASDTSSGSAIDNIKQSQTQPEAQELDTSTVATPPSPPEPQPEGGKN